MANIFTLSSSDGQVFEVEEKVVMQSDMIKNMIEDCSNISTIPLPNITGNILSKVIEYCKKHADTPAAGVDDHGKELGTWDSEFANVDKETLFEMILAANYLNIEGLMDLTCQTAANMIRDVSVEEVRQFFDIENDFTPEEEKELQNEHPWAFK